MNHFFISDSFSFLLITIFFSPFCFQAQKNEIKQDTLLVHELLKKSDSKGWNNADSMIYYASRALSISKDINYTKGIIISNLSIALAEYVNGNYANGLEAARHALELAKMHQRKKYIRDANNIIGLLYQQMKKNRESIDFFKAALKLSDSASNPVSFANTCNNIANSYFSIRDYENMNFYRNKALNIRKKLNLVSDIADSYNDIGLYFFEKNLLDTAEKCFMLCYRIKDSIGDLEMKALSLLNLAKVSVKKNEWNRAEYFLTQVRKLSIQISAPYYLKEALEKLVMVYEQKNDIHSQNQVLKQLIKLNDSLNTLENRKQLNRLFVEFETEKKELEIKNLKKLQGEKEKRNKLIYIFITIVVLFLITFLIFFINRYRIISKQKARIQEQNKILEENYYELEQKNKLIQQQKDIIEQKNREITDSIVYARRIQDAILPSEILWRKCFPESFILYLPKDIVSGDFYWLTETAEYVFVAAADCTGHGVPGSFVSFTCYNALNKTVMEEKIFQTDQILNKTRDIVVQQFYFTYDRQLRDGMDICLVRFDKRNPYLIQYTGAHRSLIIISEKMLKEYKPDKQPIGYYESANPFSYQNITLTASCTLYLYTDGFPDQFGGDKNKKLGSKKWKDILTEISEMNMDKQWEYLNDFFHKWKGNGFQTDDVTVIGIRI